MKNRITPKQMAANQRNALKSTGPKSANGKAISKMNAMKHGILSKQVLVKGYCINESSREYAALHQRFWDELQPEGPVEEMLVDQIVTCHWRLRRALTAESGEIALGADSVHRKRQEGSHPRVHWALWEIYGDPVPQMEKSSLGNGILIMWLNQVIAQVEREGELTEAATSMPYCGKPNSLTHELEDLRQTLQENPEGLGPEALKVRNKQKALDCLLNRRRWAERRKYKCQAREDQEAVSREAAASLPSAEVLEKITRYESKLNRQLFRAIALLERLQRMRRGETIPAPVTVDIAERA